MKKRPTIDFVIMLLLFIGSFVLRFAIIEERKIMPAGDAFNFHMIAGALTDFSYPVGEKRLPVYPLLLLPGRLLGFDPIRTSLAVTILASSASTLILYGLLRTLAVHRVAALIFTGVSMFDPLLIINGVRPLADGLFVFLILLLTWLSVLLLQQENPPSSKQIYWLGFVMTLLMFTRYEGVIISAIVVGILFFRFSYKHLMKLILIPCVSILLWIPVYIHTYGSLSGLPYISDATSGNHAFGELSGIPVHMKQMLGSAGFLQAWSVPESELEQNPKNEAFVRIIHNPSWWLSICALIGIPSIIIRHRLAGALIVTLAIAYTLLLSWWWVYSRYIAPLSFLFYIIAAVGFANFFITGKKFEHTRLLAGTVIGFLVLSSITPLLYRDGLNRAWEDNGRDFALYEAMRYLVVHKIPVALEVSYPMALSQLGNIVDKPSNANPRLAFYTESYKDKPIEEVVADMKKYNVHAVLEYEHFSLTNALLEYLRTKETVRVEKVFPPTLLSEKAIEGNRSAILYTVDY